MTLFFLFIYFYFIFKSPSFSSKGSFTEVLSWNLFSPNWFTSNLKWHLTPAILNPSHLFGNGNLLLQTGNCQSHFAKLYQNVIGLTCTCYRKFVMKKRMDSERHLVQNKGLENKCAKHLRWSLKVVTTCIFWTCYIKLFSYVFLIYSWWLNSASA